MSSASNQLPSRDSTGAFVGSGLVFATYALDLALKDEGFEYQQTYNKAALKAAGQKTRAFVSNVAAMRAAGKTDDWITQGLILVCLGPTLTDKNDYALSKNCNGID